MIENVINNSSIWDLHIHSCKSPKSSGNFQKMDVDSFIDKLLLIFKDYPDLNLISFTDHNSISHEVYETFIKKEKNIQIIPGIEIDVEIDGVKNAKHMLFYVNISIEQLKTFSKDINAFLCGKDSVPLNSVLEFIIERKVEFLISPHAFKQGKRGINFDWTQEEITNKNMHKYMDQFFCFWEAAGHSDIAKAEQFLKSFDQEDKISIISFSDSSDEEKLREYLDNPPQYFKSLPNYKGLQLVGTDCRRILKEKKKLDYDNTGNFIGSISINGKNINMSDQLNVIVGGRGSGKSVLLDNIALNLDSDIRNKNRIDKTRIEYLDKININVMNFDNSKVRIDSKKIDYFDQSYISKIFNSDDTSKAMAEYFMDEFANLDDKEGLIKIQNLKERYIENIQTTISSKPITNISNLVGKYKLIDDKKIDIKIKKTDIQKLKQINYSIDDAIKYAIDRKAAFVEDMNPLIIKDFNNLVATYASNSSFVEAPLWVPEILGDGTPNGHVDQKPVKIPYIDTSTDHGIATYKLKFKKAANRDN